MNPEGRMLNSVKSFFGSVASLAFYPVWTIVHVLFHIQKVANVLHVRYYKRLLNSSSRFDLVNFSLKGSFGQIKSKSAPRSRIVSVYNMHGWFQGVKQTLIAQLRKVFPSTRLARPMGVTWKAGKPWVAKAAGGGKWASFGLDQRDDGDCGALFFDDRENGKQRLIDCARELCGDAKRSKESSREIHASDIEEHLHKKLRCRNEACFAQGKFACTSIAIPASRGKKLCRQSLMLIFFPPVVPPLPWTTSHFLVQTAALAVFASPSRTLPSASGQPSSSRTTTRERRKFYVLLFLWEGRWQTRLTEFFEGGELKQAKDSDLGAILLRFSSSEVCEPRIPFPLAQDPCRFG
eukprot:768293-Hanusia_phi.AAC.1